MDRIFYDQFGRAIAYSEDNIHIFLYSGDPVAYIIEESVYSFEGKHLGWFVDGWVCDQDGDRVYYTENALGGPEPPITEETPAKGIAGPLPEKHGIEAKPAKPSFTFTWSRLHGEAFFNQ